MLSIGSFGRGACCTSGLILPNWLRSLECILNGYMKLLYFVICFGSQYSTEKNEPVKWRVGCSRLVQAN